MPAIQNGTVYVRNASATVRHVWNLVVSGYVALTKDEAVTWSGGSGVFLSDEPALSRIKVVRTSGNVPVAGSVIDGATGTATVTQYAPGSPGKWNLGTIGANPVWFHRAGAGKLFQVSTILGTDELLLTVPYDDPDEDDAAYGITQDYTANLGLPLAQLGDVDALAVLSRCISQLDIIVAALMRGETLDLPAADPGVTGQLYYDGSGFVRRSE